MPDDTYEIVLKKNRENAISRLSASEMQEYEKHVRLGKPDLAPDTNQKFYELYLQGMSVDEISSLNPALSKGCIVKAKVDGLWDERKEVYLTEVLSEVPDRVKQLAAEALGFMSLQLAVAHKEYGVAYKKYLQSGNPNDLGTFRITNFREYKSVIESVARLLDAGRPKEGGSATINVNAHGPISVMEENSSPKRFTAADADAIREFLEKKK